MFVGFSGEGFARMDFRVTADGRIYFLEVNFTCSVFYPEGYQGSADYILSFHGMGQAEFLRALIDEGRARHARRQRPWAVGAKGDTFGVFAARPLAKGAVVFEGEGQPQRIISRAHVERTWSEADRDVFYRYAYPIGPEVFVLWDQQPVGLGAAEPLVRAEHGVRGPERRRAARHRGRRGADGRLRHLLRHPHDPVRLRVRQPALPGPHHGRAAGCSGEAEVSVAGAVAGDSRTPAPLSGRTDRRAARGGSSADF